MLAAQLMLILVDTERSGSPTEPRPNSTVLGGFPSFQTSREEFLSEDVWRWIPGAINEDQERQESAARLALQHQSLFQVYRLINMENI